MAAGNGLVLRFGTDFGDSSAKLGELAGSVAKNMAGITAAAIATSKVLRTEVAAAAADASKSIASHVLTINNLKVASQLAGEVMKVSFALHHPVLATGMQLLGNYKFALGAVAAGALGAAEAAKWMADQVARANEIIAKAEKAGVSNTFFQVWTDQAVKARLSVEEMEQALQRASQVLKPTFTTGGEQNINEFLRYSDQLQNGRGFATQSYQAFRVVGGELYKLQSAGEFFVQDFMRAAVELDDASLKAQAGQIATQLWGEAGTKLAAALAAGKISVEDVATRARDMGTVFSEDVLNATKAVNQELAEARKRLSDELHPAMEGLVRLSNSLLSTWAKIVDAIASGVRFLGSIKVDFAGAAAEGAVGALPDRASFGEATGPLADALRRKFGEPTDTPFTPRPANVPVPPRRPSLSVLESPSPRVASGGSGASEAQSAVDQYIASLEKANAVALAELDTIGKSNIEKAKAVDLARAEEAAKKDGAALTDEQRAKVLALAEAEGRLKDQTEETNKAIANRKAMGDYFGNMGESAVEKLIVDHKNLRNVLGDVVKELERAAIKYALLGNGFGQSSGGGGLFGGLFGGKGGGLFSGLFGGGSGKEMNWLADLFGFNPFGFDVGGMVGAGGRPMGVVPISAWRGAPRFADGGGIPAIVHAGEIILNQAQQRNVASAMGGGSKVNVHNYAAGIDVKPQITPEGVDLIVRSRIAENNAGIPGMLSDKQSRTW